MYLLFIPPLRERSCNLNAVPTYSRTFCFIQTPWYLNISFTLQAFTRVSYHSFICVPIIIGFLLSLLIRALITLSSRLNTIKLHYYRNRSKQLRVRRLWRSSSISTLCEYYWLVLSLSSLRREKLAAIDPAQTYKQVVFGFEPKNTKPYVSGW